MHVSEKTPTPPQTARFPMGLSAGIHRSSNASAVRRSSLLLTRFALTVITAGFLGTAFGQSSDKGQQPTENVAPGGPENIADWTRFLEVLKDLATQQPRVAAQKLTLSAADADLAEQRGDLGLSLTATYTEYPGDGLSATDPDLGGGTASDSFTDLETRTSARFNFNLLDVVTRRPFRVNSAEAMADKARHDVVTSREEALTEFVRDTISVWSVRSQRRALTSALDYVQKAKGQLRLAATASLPEITRATPTNVVTALTTYNRIRTRLDGLATLRYVRPDAPADYSVLPLQPPGIDDLERIASNSPMARSLQAEAKAMQETANSLWGNGVTLGVYAGYVNQTRQDVPGSDEGPEYGVNLTMPLGASDHFERKASKYRSDALKQQAVDAIYRRQRMLLQLRENWVTTVADLAQAEADLRLQERELGQLRKRASLPQSGKTPQPWETNLQLAEYWYAVAEVWQQRGLWVQNVLTWAIFDPGYIDTHRRAQDPVALQSFCAPLESCEQVIH